MGEHQSATFLAAKEMARTQGWSIIPVEPGGKKPAVKWKPYQERKSTATEWNDWFNHRDWLVGAVTGRVSGIVVLDIDTEGAWEWWIEQVGEEVLESAAKQITPKTTQRGASENLGHYIWSYPSGPAQWPNRSVGEEGDPIRWDLRGDGGYIKVPPSAGYQWVRPWTPAVEELPQVVRDLVRSVGRRRDATATRSDGEVVSMGTLTSLLANPGLGGRNNWVTQVLGHYAKTFRFARDAYEFHAEQVWETASSLPGEHEYERDEFERTLESIWNREFGKIETDPETGLPTTQATYDNGFLVGTGQTLMIQVRMKDDDGNSDLGMAEWADCDLQALGVVDDEHAHRTYDLVVRTRRMPEGRRVLLDSDVLADQRRLAAWLANQGAGIAPPDNVHPRSIAAGERVRRYLESQEPERFRVVEALGWDTDGFVCHEGVIQSEGLQPFMGRRPHPQLINRAPFRYGFVDEAEAVAVLREVLTFHDETVTAVFGSWWAACLLKPQIQERMSLFPIMALQAPAESGKSTGFFALMLQLNGNTQKQGTATMASVRDMVAAHHSGIVWIDDHDRLDHLSEVLRGATGEGTMTKKGEDRTSQVTVQLVAPMLISGEALGWTDQKAMLDRSVRLEVPAPTKRKSLHDPNRLQWDDIVALNERYGHDLTRVAGTLVQMALQRVGQLEDIRSLVPPAGGRWGDKIAIVRFGARLLADMVGDKSLIERVDAWADEQDNQGSENTLTLRLLPAALQMHDWPNRAEPAMGDRPATPVLLHKSKDQDEPELVFNPRFLADWWSTWKKGRVNQRTESYDAIVQQARALGLSGGQKGARKIRLGSAGNHLVWFWRCGPDITQIVLGRSMGRDQQDRTGHGTGHGTGGFHPEELRQRMLAFPLAEQGNWDGEGL
jgi:hypothetical protein